MNDTQRQQIEKLRAEGLSYGKISDALGLSTNTIKTYCRKLEITKSLSAAGIQYIEAGFPATSKMEQRGLKNNANAGLSLKITCLCSGMGKDIDIAKLCDADGVIIELTVSYPRIKYQLDWEVQRQ